MIYVYALVFLVVVAAGAVMAYLGHGFGKKGLPFLITFVAAYVFSSTLVHLLPEVMHQCLDTTSVGLSLLFGFLVQHLIVQYSRGVEHGHTHNVEDKGIGVRQLLIALIFHSSLEGLVGLHMFLQKSAWKIDALFLGIILHKLPAAYALTSILRKQHKHLPQVIYSVGLFGMATPVTLILAYAIRDSLSDQGWSGVVLPFLGGMFLHLSTAMFFEVAPKHVYGWHKNGILILGVTSAVLIEYAMRFFV